MNNSKRITVDMLIGIVALILLVPLYYLFFHINSIKLKPGEIITRWVQSQNGNDDSALLDVERVGDDNSKIRYSVEKYAEIGIITLPDVDTIFSSLLGGTKVRDIGTLPFADGLTIIDQNKTSYMDGIIRFWKVVSREDDNDIRLVVFRYDEVTKKYRLIDSSQLHSAQKGLNTFYEEVPLSVKKDDIIGLQAKKSIASNRVMYNEFGSVLTRSGFQNSLDKSNSVEDFGGKGSFSFSALLDVGKEEGEISVQNDGASFIKLPVDPVYGHLSWYRFTFMSDAGTLLFRPRLASILLNADPYIGLIPSENSPWTPKAFSFPLLVLLALLLIALASLLAPETINPRWMRFKPQLISIVCILAIFYLSRHFAEGRPGLQFVVSVAAFIIVFLLPGSIISRYYTSYGREMVSGRTILAFVLSLIYWFIPAIGLFLIKTSYWPVIVAGIILIVILFLKQPLAQKRDIVVEDLSLGWRIVQYVSWGFVGLLTIHTLFSTRFHAEIFDCFHHISLAAKNFTLPIAGDVHANLYGATMRTTAPYAYNIWCLLVGMVVKISGVDIGTVYCVGNSLLVMLMFIAQWWLIGIFVDSRKIRILAFAIILMIYVTRSMAMFAPIFQRSEFNFIMYGPSIHEYFLYAIYMILGVRAVISKSPADLFVYCGLSLVMAFFHLEFLFINYIVLFLLILISLRENGKRQFGRTQAYLLLTAVLLAAIGFLVRSHLALGNIIPDSNSLHSFYYDARYGDHAFIQRFYYIFKDLLKFVNSYVWSAVAIWGGLLLVIFPSRKVSMKLFKSAYLLIVLMLIISYNPISDIIFTPIITSVPASRIEIYLRPILYMFAATLISVYCFYISDVAMKYVNNHKRLLYVFPAALLLMLSLTYQRWLPQMMSAVYTITYNQGAFLDITYDADLPEIKYLNDHSKGRYVNVLVEHPYNYVIPSLTTTYSYFHKHYPLFDPSYSGREPIWKKCLSSKNDCRSELPKDSLILVRNEEAKGFAKVGYTKLYEGRLFTILKI